MNGIYNLIFIVLLMFTLVAFDYMYSIGDIIVNKINTTVTSFTWFNATSTGGLTTTHAGNSYVATRSLLYSIITGVMVPFLLFLSFTSSFINRNQNVIMYLIQVIALLMLTPLAIYLFSDLITNMLNVSILDHAYMATVFFTNFPYILIANSLMALASFVFVQKTASVT